MAKVINKYAESVMLRSVNRLINKYGHNVELHQEREGQPAVLTPSKATFGRFKVAFGNGNLIINNNYKVRLRADSFPFDIIPSDDIIVNGASLNVVTARKISPDGATTIVWELECSGEVIPADGNSAGVPSVLAPTNNTSFYPSVAEDAGSYSASFTASAYEVLSGDTTYVSSDWQISTDEAFSFIQNEVYGHAGVTWTSDVVLDNPVNYYVRVRHNGTGGVITDWSAGNLFSLGEIGSAPVEDIATPSLTTPGGYLTSDSTYFREYDPDTSGFVYKAAVFLSAFSSGTGKVFDHVHWQVSNNSTFTSIVWEGNSSGGYDPDIITLLDYNQLMMPWVEYSYSAWYIRGKYVSTDATESEYSEYVQYFMN